MADSPMVASIAGRESVTFSQQTPRSIRGISGQQQAAYPSLSTARSSRILLSCHPYLRQTPVRLGPAEEIQSLRRHRYRSTTLTSVRDTRSGYSAEMGTEIEQEVQESQPHRTDQEISQMRQQGAAMFGRIDTTLHGKQQVLQGQQAGN